MEVETHTKGFFPRINRYFRLGIWQEDLSQMPKWRRPIVRFLRIMMICSEGFVRDQCALKSSALTFLSALSIVPLLMMVFGISQAFGFDIKTEIAALTRGNEEIMDQIFEFSGKLLDKTRRDLLAVASLVVLFFTVLRLLHNIEYIFNGIWGIDHPRSLQRKFTDYTAILLFAPILVFISGSLNVFIETKVMEFAKEWDLFGGSLTTLINILIGLLPLSLLWLLLVLLYLIMPNTQVRLQSAALAALVAGTAFQLVQRFYIGSQVEVTGYNAIYGSLAAIPLFLIWLQISWMIALFGAELAYAFQNEQDLFSLSSVEPSITEKKYIALLVMREVTVCFVEGEMLTSHEISRKTKLSTTLIRVAIKDLRRIELVSEVQEAGKTPHYKPAIDIHQITPRLVVNRLESHGFTGLLINQRTTSSLRISSMLAQGQLKEGSTMDVPLVDL